jgi:methyl-accepting chemotaxis protein
MTAFCAGFLAFLLFLLNLFLNILMKTPLQRLIAQFEKAGQGDLTHRLTGKYIKKEKGDDVYRARGRDEFSELGTNFNMFMSNISAMVIEL